MQYLASPYLTKEKEAVYIHKFGTHEDRVNRLAEEEKQRSMPGEAKYITEHGKSAQIYGNYGNLLHKHRTVEDSMTELIRRERWD